MTSEPYRHIAVSDDEDEFVIKAGARDETPRPKATDAAPNGPKHQRRMAREGLSCLARNANPFAGEESRDAPLRHRRSRLEPSFGQISPQKRPFGAHANE